MIPAYIGLGSNLNNPSLQIQTAINALKTLANSVFVKVSSLYQTKPVGFLDQPDFINAVALIHTSLCAQELLAELLSLENTFGRIRGKDRNRPRILDLDILLYSDCVVNDINLIVPHPRLEERDFVLTPLCEISPELRLPNGKRVIVLKENLCYKTLLSKNT